MATAIEVPGVFRFSNGKVEFVLAKYGTAVDFSAIANLAQLHDKLFDMANVGYLELFQELKSRIEGGELDSSVNSAIKEAEAAVASQAKRVEEEIAAQKAKIDEFTAQVAANIKKA